MPRGYVDTSMGQIHYVKAGAGKTLVLLSASGRSSRMFAQVMPLLAPQFAVYAFDTPGFGKSEPLPHGTTIEQLADCFLQVLDRLGIQRTHLYGLHSGNKIATCMAVRSPGRIDHLVLAGQSHSLIPDREKRNAAILAIVREYVETSRQEVATALADWAALFQRISAIWWERSLVAGGALPESNAFARNLAVDEIEAEGTADLYAANFAYDLGRDFARLTVPTLILEIATPDEDRTIGRQGPEVQRLIPGARLRTITEPLGHTLTLENRARDLADILVETFASTA
jgi:pimeloyl-ACP methyl ester carboxylesterase